MIQPSHTMNARPAFPKDMVEVTRTAVLNFKDIAKTILPQFSKKKNYGV